jgi:multisubunit Na+/H+ antiporter MnhB subunit
MFIGILLKVFQGIAVTGVNLFNAFFQDHVTGASTGNVFVTTIIIVTVTTGHIHPDGGLTAFSTLGFHLLELTTSRMAKKRL